MNRNLRNLRTFASAILSAGMCCNPMPGQGPVIMTIDTQNVVEYQADTGNVPQYATNPNVVPAAPIRNFTVATPLGDIVAVNGETAKGLYTSVVTSILASPTPDASEGGAIADSTAGSIRQQIFHILKSDGTAVGTIIAMGLNGDVAPGSPAAIHNGDWAIVGGTGAFLGVRGQMGRSVQTVAARAASTVEDPGNRRINGGGTLQWVFTLFPMSTPQIITTATGPAITHSADFTIVSAANPATAGEILSLFATGLGPTNPGVDPGQPFTANPLQVVNSPVKVLVNGESAEVLAAVGFAGASDGYQVNFQVPPGTAKGTATIQVSAAWIPGNTVSIPIQ